MHFSYVFLTSVPIPTNFLSLAKERFLVRTVQGLEFGALKDEIVLR